MSLHAYRIQASCVTAVVFFFSFSYGGEMKQQMCHGIASSVVEEEMRDFFFFLETV